MRLSEESRLDIASREDAIELVPLTEERDLGLKG